eukprot:SAG22_NODE_478_length_9967_cov_12.777260_4_plen_46_part_00
MDEKADRFQTLMPYQVTEAVMAQAKPDAVFMNWCARQRAETAGSY